MSEIARLSVNPAKNVSRYTIMFKYMTACDGCDARLPTLHDNILVESATSNQKAKGDACGLTSDTDDRASSLHQYAIPLRCCIYVHMNRLNLDSINMNT